MNSDIYYQNGSAIDRTSFHIPTTNRPDFESSYIFAFHKSGSVLVNSIVGRVMDDVGIPVVDIPVFLFNKGVAISSTSMNLKEVFMEKGYCYLGFREMLPCMRGAAGKLKGKKILFVRDPRDMIVSLFYSLKFSHKFPESGTPQF